MLLHLNEITITPEYLQDINALIKELSPTKNITKTLDEIHFAVLKPNSSFIVCIEDLDGRKAIVGMGSIHFFDTLIERKAIIENVVVNSNCRGKKIGYRITYALLGIAENLKVKEINLTSGAHRIAAQALYKSLGFEVPNSTLFRIRINGSIV